MSHDDLWSKHPLEHEDYMTDAFSADEMSAEETEELEVLLQSLKNSDDVALPESGIYFDALEARIMGALDSAIEHGEVEDRDQRKKAPIQEINPVAAKASMKRASSRRALAVRAGQMVMFVGVAIVMTGKWLIAPSPSRPSASSSVSESESARSSVLRATHAAAPKVLASTVMTFESIEDLAFEIAARQVVARHMKN